MKELQKKVRELEDLVETSAKDSANSDTIKLLQDQLSKLRQEFGDKIEGMKEETVNLRAACDDKDALVAEANRAIEDCNEELHDVKAKLKHMVQVHYQGLSYSADLSSYKGDDSSLSVNVCLD